MPLLEKLIKKNNIDAEIAFTIKHGHAAELSGTFLGKGFRYIIGVGGDGTLNEIARPLIGNKEVITGLIPAGTGNDFIQILGFPTVLLTMTGKCFSKVTSYRWMWEM